MVFFIGLSMKNSFENRRLTSLFEAVLVLQIFTFRTDAGINPEYRPFLFAPSLIF